jgi:5'-nucleotidase
MVRILITNDDGIDSVGIRALADAATTLGDDVVVAAPAWNSSGASASITGVAADGRLVWSPRRLPSTGLDMAYAVESSPAMIVRAAIRGAFGPPPDLVLSGINDGPNTGHAVLHSGTVGAALTAATHGCRAVAFSLGIGAEPDYRSAAALAPAIIAWASGAPGPLVLNVNVPSGPPTATRGVRPAPLAGFGAVQTNITELGEGYVEVSFVDVDPTAEAGSDATLLADGYATVTALSPVCEARGVDLDSLVHTIGSSWAAGS